MSRRSLPALLLMFAVVLPATTGCWEQWSESWFPQMKWQQAVQAFERVPGRVEAFSPPEGTVPVEPLTPDYARLDVAGLAQLKNPTNPSDFRSLARGQEIYETYCTVCHGASGNGDGPVSAAGDITGPFAGVWPLATATAQSDGYIYNLIRIGSGGQPGYRMPAYSHIPSEDRWHLVNYVRFLQRGGRP